MSTEHRVLRFSIFDLIKMWLKLDLILTETFNRTQLLYKMFFFNYVLINSTLEVHCIGLALF